MIAGLVGSSYSGKNTLAKYLEERYQFERVDLNNLQPELQPEQPTTSPVDDEASSSTEESKEGTSPKKIEVAWNDVSKISKIIQKIMEVDWKKNWVIYPLPQTAEMQSLLKSARLTIYRVEAPLDRRFQRSGQRDLAQFIQESSAYERAMLSS